MLLALLMLVVGRLGGPLGGVGAAAALLTLEAERAMGGAPPPGGIPGGALAGGMVEADTERGGPPGGPPGGAAPGGGVPLTERGAPPLGGGGVGLAASTCSAPGFLLIQRFSSGSYTKLLASPSLARTGLFRSEVLPLDGMSPFLPPPNQFEKPQPFLVCCCSAARLAAERC